MKEKFHNLFLQHNLKIFNKNKKFGISDYINMFKARGFKLVIEYFLFNHLFDILNGTDTHAWNHNKLISKFEDSEIYMGTWSKDVKESTLKLNRLIKKNIEKFNFIDIGSGKGKVLIIWKKLFPKNNNIYGIEYDKSLIEIAENNFKKLNYKRPKFFKEDISIIELSKNLLNKNTILFLFNPCGEKTLKDFFKKNEFKKSYIIYFNPIYTDLIINFEYKLIYEKFSYRKGSSFKIFEKIP